MDRLDELAILVAIVDAGSLAGAARRLRRSTAAVTRALAALEERVGARLIDRTTRRLSVTEAGRTFAERARALAADYEAAMTDVAEAQVRGLLRVTAPTPFGRRYVTPIVSDFLEANAAVQIELVLDDRNLDF
ncbi:MAG: LysR family transcriptional regulator, partial [Beijerinckiaceae bacterium]|nr:LysR family transcriptional regulator [Beijerinckiaceae bacterium]